MSLDKNEEIKKLVDELSEKGKINLPGKGVLECKNDRIVWSNPYNLSAGTRFLKAGEAHNIIESYIDAKIEKMNAPKADGQGKKNYKTGNNTLAALKKKVG
jgi:hypothetical protein